jgi:predicted lipoprotein with Yx(FWY)xxD motif
MKRLICGLAAILAAGLLAGPALAKAGTKLQLRHTAVGTILVDGHGFTLYAFTRDSRNRDKCVSISGCPSIWLLLTTNGKVSPGGGVKRGLLGTIKVGNRRQVTYAGHPLYTYIGDAAPGSTGYIGVHQFGGAWDALNARGQIVR